jgi:hypothetical protein
LPSSQHPHQVTALCLRRPSRRLRLPRRRTSCAGVTSTCCTTSSSNLMSSSLFPTRMIRLGGRGGSAQARSGGKATRVRSQQNRYVCISLIHTLRLSADRHYAGLRAHARMRRHGSNTSATRPQYSPSDPQARISARTSPLEPRLRCSASSRRTNQARRRASPSTSSASRMLARTVC